MKLHTTDWVSLIFGLIFLGLAGLWLAAHLATLSIVLVGWLLAAGLILFGGAGIAAAINASRRHTDDQNP